LDQDVWVYLITQVTSWQVGISEAGITGSAECIRNSSDGDRAGLVSNVIYICSWQLGSY